MKRRLTIARSLVNDPELLLLDEPTTGLDPQARHLLWERLYRLKREGVTQIVTTHYMDEAEQLCDRLAVMDGGVIAAEGSPAELIARYSTREVLELRFPPDVAAPVEPTRLAERVEVLPDRLLLYTADGEHLQGELARNGVRPQSALVRRSSLEDVFPAHRPEPGRLMAERIDLPSTPARHRVACRRGTAHAHRACRGRRARRPARRRAPLDVVPTELARHRRVSILQPLLFLLAFGLGFGALIDGTGRAADATGGVPYLVWLAPALLAMSAVQTAVFDSAYPVLSGFKWQRVYWAMTATPISPGQVALGHLAWFTVKATGSGAIYVAVIAVFGGVRTVGIAFSLLAAVLTGVAVSAVVAAFTAGIDDEGTAFTVLFRWCSSR